MKRIKNTKFQGAATVFLYREKDRYIGVCLEFDIIDEDKDKDQLFERMKDRVDSFVKYVQKKDLDENLLNRPAPIKYWKKFDQLTKSLGKESSNAVAAQNKLTAGHPTQWPRAFSEVDDFAFARVNLTKV